MEKIENFTLKVKDIANYVNQNGFDENDDDHADIAERVNAAAAYLLPKDWKVNNKFITSFYNTRWVQEHEDGVGEYLAHWADTLGLCATTFPGCCGLCIFHSDINSLLSFDRRSFEHRLYMILFYLYCTQMHGMVIMAHSVVLNGYAFKGDVFKYQKLEGSDFNNPKTENNCYMSRITIDYSETITFDNCEYYPPF